MAFQVLPCEIEDMQEAFALVTDTFQHDQPYHDALWPDHWTARGQEIGAKRFQASKVSEPNLRFLKAVETSSGDLAGLVRYYVLPAGTALDENDLQGNYWPDEDSREYARHLYRNYLSARRKTVREVGTPFVCECHRSKPFPFSGAARADNESRPGHVDHPPSLSVAGGRFSIGQMGLRCSRCHGRRGEPRAVMEMVLTGSHCSGRCLSKAPYWDCRFTRNSVTGS